MAFTINCEKCGTTQEIKNRNTKLKNIDVFVEMDSFDDIKGIEFWCINEKCNNRIGVDY